MWLLAFFLITNAIGVTAFLMSLVIWRRESGGAPAWLITRQGIATLLLLATGAGLIVGGSYRLVHWIAAWRQIHAEQLALNPLFYDSTVLPRGWDFLSPRMAAITAACLALLILGAGLRAFARPANGGQAVRGKSPLVGCLAVALIVTLAELSVFQYVNQATIGMKELPIRGIETGAIDEKQIYKNYYTFRPGTERFFAPSVATWEKALEGYKGRPDVRYLEVGIFEGHSALWMLENVLTHPTAHLTGIDPFFPESPPKKSYKDTFYSNLRLSGLEEKATIIEGFSQVELRKLPLESFDIIYIDGSHDPADCLEDAVLAWRLLKDGGILIFDDYLFNALAFSPGEKPKIGIDTFLGLFHGHFSLVHSDWQVILRKKMAG